MISELKRLTKEIEEAKVVKQISEDNLIKSTHLMPEINNSLAGVSKAVFKRPGGYITADVDVHGNLSPGENRAEGHRNIAEDGRIQSHHPIQNEWAKRWTKKKGLDYNENKALAILLKSSSGNAHAKISLCKEKEDEVRVITRT